MQLPRSNLSTTALALLVFLGAVLACESSNREIDRILDTKTDEEAGDQLKIHGPIRAEEVPYIYKATSSSTENRRRNAAGLLTATLKGNADELRHRALTETKDVVVWAILIDGLLDKEPELTGNRHEMIKAALGEQGSDTLAVGLRAAVLSNYPGIHQLVRKYLDHPDGKVRAAAVSGLLSEDIRELLPRLQEMIAKETDEDTFISLAKSLIRTNDANATAVVVKAIEHLKETKDSLWLHFFNDLALFAKPDAITDKFLFALAQSNSSVREEGFSVLTRQVWANHREPSVALVKMCTQEIEKGTLNPDPRRRPEAKAEQEDCEEMLSFMNNGKNPISDFDGLIRGADAAAFAKKWLKEHGN